MKRSIVKEAAAAYSKQKGAAQEVKRSGAYKPVVSKELDELRKGLLRQRDCKRRIRLRRG
jgi:hypothetical protein